MEGLPTANGKSNTHHKIYQRYHCLTTTKLQRPTMRVMTAITQTTVSLSLSSTPEIQPFKFNKTCWCHHPLQPSQSPPIWKTGIIASTLLMERRECQPTWPSSMLPTGDAACLFIPVASWLLLAGSSFGPWPKESTNMAIADQHATRYVWRQASLTHSQKLGELCLLSGFSYVRAISF